MCSNRGDVSIDAATDNKQLSLAVGGVHVEGVAEGLSGLQWSASVSDEHQWLQVDVILSRNLNDGFAVKQLNLSGLTI